MVADTFKPAARVVSKTAKLSKLLQQDFPVLLLKCLRANGCSVFQ
jgi:hypothetical protein